MLCKCCQAKKRKTEKLLPNLYSPERAEEDCCQEGEMEHVPAHVRS